jgi:hypothetical protein
MSRRHNIIYPLVAAMSLFVNILIHPIGPQAAADTESLVLALTITDRIRLWTVSDHVMKDAEQARQLITELLNLANSAILKANRITALNKPPDK